MQSFLLDVSPTGVQHKAHISADGDELILEEYTPTAVEKEILDSCAAMRSVAQTKGRGMQLAARTPINTWMAWRKEWREKYSKDWSWATFESMKLNSREYSNFRTGYKRGGSMKL